MPRVHVESGPHAGGRFEVDESAVIGRLEANAVPLPRDDEASRRHAAFRRSGGRLLLVDLDSRNGTRVNGAKIKQVALADGDVIEVGLTRLRLELELEPEPEPGETGAAEPARPERDSARRRARGASARLARERPPAGEEAANEPGDVDRDGEGDEGQDEDEDRDADRDEGHDARGRDVDPVAVAADGLSTRQAVQVLLFILLVVLVFLDVSYAARIVARIVLR